jgi:translation initiation factor 5
MSDIAAALDRPAEYPTKFFGFEKGALTKIDKANNKYIVNGKHSAEDLAVVLDQFIERYVLCKKCRNPETELRVKGESIQQNCKACGKRTSIDMSHKLSTYILKNPPHKKLEAKQAPSKKDLRAQKKQKQQEEVEDEEVEWFSDFSKAAVEQRRKELLGDRDRLSNKSSQMEGLVVKPGQDPLSVLREYWRKDESDEGIVKTVRTLQLNVKWSETQLIKSIFYSLFDKNIRKGFYKKVQILQLFVNNEKAEKIVLYCLERLCQQFPSAIQEVPHVLNAFWKFHICEQDTLIKWFNFPNKRTDPKFSQAMRDASKPFIDWLQSNDTDDEDSF